MILAIRIEIILMTALFVVAPDHGNRLFKNSLIMPFPAPKINEYISDTSTESIKFANVFSSVNTKKKNSDVPSEIQSSTMTFLRFISCYYCFKSHPE